MLDPSIGEFVLTDPQMRIPSRGKIYSINEGYENKWEPAIYEYVKSKKQGPKAYGARYKLCFNHKHFLLFLHFLSTPCHSRSLKAHYRWFFL